MFLRLVVLFVLTASCPSPARCEFQARHETHVSTETRRLADYVLDDDLLGYLVEYNTWRGTSFESSKASIVSQCAEIEGDVIQLLRLLCWLSEKESDLRKMLMEQWLNELKRKKQLPDLDSLVAKLRTLLKKRSTDETEKRLREIREIYPNLTPNKVIKSKDSQYLFGIMTYKTYGPFFDKKCMANCVLLSGDESRILEAYKKSLVLRSRTAEVLEYGGIPFESQEVGDASLYEIVRDRTSKWDER